MRHRRRLHWSGWRRFQPWRHRPDGIAGSFAGGHGWHAGGICWHPEMIPRRVPATRVQPGCQYASCLTWTGSSAAVMFHRSR